ncbi:MAG TPA: TlyA family RNA methyltransferase [Verrucomicrobiae bacterium]|nr:TlyA family RNA methyltransferase [Verrucomicrobiae bacterium]
MRARLDTQLVARGLCETREKAKRLVLAGAVRVNGQLAHKPSEMVDEQTPLSVDAAEKYVSRGGHKLEAALDRFHISCDGLVCADLGASTGGFTDCLLQRGAARVHAVDVGKGQLDWKLRQNSRVIVHDKQNARHVTPDGLGDHVDLVTIDVSFISLTKVLPAAVALLKPAGGTIVALIKPQFEAGKKLVKRGGVVRDSRVHEAVISMIEAFAIQTLGLTLLGVTESPLLGPAGNKEFLIVLRTS